MEEQSRTRMLRLIGGERSRVKIVKADRLRPVVGHVSVALDRLMLVWGGYHINEQNVETFNAPKDLLVYDTLLDRWFCFKTTGEHPPESTGSCAVLVETTLYVFGGFFETAGGFARVYALDLRSLIWRHVAPSSKSVPTTRHKLGGWYHKNKLYFFGGYGTPPEVAASHQHAIDAGWQYLRSKSSNFISDHNLISWNDLLISFDLDTKLWELHPLVGNAPSARAAHSVVFVPESSKAIVFGGRLLRERMNDMYVLDLPSMVWTKIETNEGPCGRSWQSLVAIDADRLLLFGGFSQHSVPLDDSWYFDIENRRWTEIKRESIKKPRLWHTGVVINRTCFIFGGCKSNILALTGEREFANDLIVIEVAPRSLSDRCFRFIADNRSIHAKRLAQLPGPLYEKFRFISGARRQKSMKTPIDLLKI